MKPPVNDEPLPAELAILLESLCLGELTALQAARIEELVDERPENCRHYVRFIQMHAFAERYEGADPGREEEQLSEFLVSAARPQWSKPTGRSRRLGLYGVAAASALAVCYYGAFAVLAWNLRPSQLPTALPSGEAAVARIAASEEVQWTAPPTGLGSDAAVQQNKTLRIESGSVEMTLFSGVRVRVRGPAEWLVDGANRATLRSGQMTAEVPTRAVGFTLMTPAAQIVDLGTEFQVDVNEHGATEVQVLRGLVHVRPAASTVAAIHSSAPRRLSAGEGVRVLPESGEMIAISSTGGLANTQRRATRSFKTRLIDLSTSGVASQSSSFSGAAYPSAHAIDGDLDTFSHTAFTDRAPWWQVDLGSSREVVAAVILNRKGTGTSRLRNIRIQVLADDGKTVVGASPLLNPGNKAWGGVLAIHQGPTDLVFDFARDTGMPVVGRYVRIERQSLEEDRVDDDHGVPILTIAEVQIFEAVSTR